MSSDLLVNPCLTFQYMDNDRSLFVLTSPKPGEGLRSLQISRESSPNLFEVFTDLSESRFDFLDVEKDLSESERRELEQYGVLVSPDIAPEVPLFECRLSGVAEWAGEIDHERLIANPTLRYEPFDLGKFGSWANEKHLSPASSTAWIRSSGTEIELGYWLDDAEAAIVSGLSASHPIARDVDEHVLRRLVAAKIVVDQESLAASESDWKGTLGAARDQFASDKYAVLRGLFPQHQIKAMAGYYRSYVDQGFMPFGDSQVEGRYRQHNEPFASFLHPQFVKLMSEIAGEEVKLSYVYAASYTEGAVLKPHTDREQCEYSISFQVDYQPEIPDSVSPWALYVEPLRFEGSLPPIGLSVEWNDVSTGDDARAIHLANGDGLVYKGRELIHYRHALPAGHRSTSLFFHFVSKDFAGFLG